MSVPVVEGLEIVHVYDEGGKALVVALDPLGLLEEPLAKKPPVEKPGQGVRHGDGLQLLAHRVIGAPLEGDGSVVREGKEKKEVLVGEDLPGDLVRYVQHPYN